MLNQSLIAMLKLTQIKTNKQINRFVKSLNLDSKSCVNLLTVCVLNTHKII